ncbi:hypothetical protein BH11GEM2_BH11GEM2_21780 [soil metagenome]
MIDQSLFHYQVECAPTSATIYLGGDKCSPRHVSHLAGVADWLPPATRMLRVDLHGVTSIDLDTLMDLRGMMARWRTARHGTVRLLVRAPLPRSEGRDTAIHFARTPLRLLPQLPPWLSTMMHARDNDIPRRQRDEHRTLSFERVGAPSARTL